MGHARHLRRCGIIHLRAVLPICTRASKSSGMVCPASQTVVAPFLPSRSFCFSSFPAAALMPTPSSRMSRSSTSPGSPTSSRCCAAAIPASRPSRSRKPTPTPTAAPSSRTSATTPSAASSSRDMTHYVRSGDFVSNLIREAQNPGRVRLRPRRARPLHLRLARPPRRQPRHRQRIPQLRRRYGPVVTYDQDPQAHLQTEFGFDVLEVMQQRYAPEAFHDFIGFQWLSRSSNAPSSTPTASRSIRCSPRKTSPSAPIARPSAPFCRR